MDVSRAILDNLMGRDRNKPMDLITQRDHYSNPDVCKSFLVCFCFNTLFPNTTYDQGPCQKRHDTYLKNMFDNDPDRAQYQRQYIKECIHWIERRLQEVEKKTKQNQSVIDNKSNFPTDRPKQILDRILAIDEDIQKLIIESQMYGQQGKIDDSSRCLEQVEKLRDRRRQIELMGSDMTNAQKQQKICLICGAIQTINDTQKRIQTHLEGKIHQGFLKLRHQVEILKIRLEVLNKLNPPVKTQRDDAERRRQQHDRRKQENEKKIEKVQKIEKIQKPKQPQIQRNNESRPDRDIRERSDSASRKRKKQRQRSREKSKQRRQRNEDKDKDRKKDSRDRDRRSRSRDKKEKKHHRDSKQRENKDRSHKESKEHKKKHKKNRSRSRDKDVQAEY